MRVTHLPYAYFEGRIVPIAEAKISIASQAVQYGEGVFGGIRGYLDQDGSTINIFRLTDHYRRFVQSANLIKVALPFDIEGLSALTVELTRRNAPASNVYYRPFAYKAGLDLGPTLTGIDDGFALYMLPLEDYLPTKGISVMVSSWRRVGDNAIPARGKVSGGYINSALIKDEARGYGFDDAIVLNERGKVSEASAANIMLLRAGTLVTPPVTADILEGITRRTLLQLARDLDIPIEEREVDRTELYVADEIFLCGTGAQVAPVTHVDRRAIGDGQLGPVTLRLQGRFFELVRGGLPQYADWLTRVPIAAPVAAD
jgi:branched-chain amino acid aminotransferase